MYKITVILPCYNVGLYLERCLDSIINQEIGYENLQIIAVNDGSVDNTLDVLLQYEQRYTDNMCVINLEENKGLSYARNLAMQYAVADYIMFIDADDWIEPDMLQRMWQVSTELNTDAVMCINDRPTCVEEAKRMQGENDLYLCPQTIEERKELFCILESNVAAWAKLIKKSVLVDHEIDFPEGYAFEDNYWTYLLYLSIKDIYVINETLYHWYFNPKSTVNSGVKYLDIIPVGEKLLEQVQARGLYESYREEIEFSYYRVVFVNTIFNAFRFGHISVGLVNCLKSIVRNRIDFTNNPYCISGTSYNNDRRIRLFSDLMIQEVDETLLLQIYNEL